MLGAAFLPSMAQAAAKPAAATVARPAGTGQSIGDFYAARRNAPLWLSARSGDAAHRLVKLLRSAKVDGLDPDKYRPETLEAAIAAAASGKRPDVERADRALSEAFVTYVRDLAADPGVQIDYVDRELRPRPPSPRAVLLLAASAPVLGDYVSRLAWMNPIYTDLRQALVRGQYANAREKELLELNLKRAQVLPGGGGRLILVNAAQQRLFLFEGGKEVDSMRVVVGKPKHPTPMMAALVRFAALNPYWYVPPDLAAERIAPRVLKGGLPYLDELGYEVLTRWDDSAEVIDPATIDWQAVADGKTEVLIRQKPGPHNSMGRMKFMFPNNAGIYLHDNPERELFNEAARLYSGGCVRLEDAARLGRWLYGYDLKWQEAEVEQRVPLRQPVPVYITYLTAMPNGESVAFFDDVYNRDAARIAGAATESGAISANR